MSSTSGSTYDSYKESGVDWIGDVPSKWIIKPLRRFISVQSGDMISSNAETETGYPIYGGNGVRGYTTCFNTKAPMILIGRVGALCGNVHLIRKNVWASEHAYRATPRSEFNIDYLAYAIKSLDLNRFAIRTAQPLLNSAIVHSQRAPSPPIPEQRAIASFLNEKCEKIDDAVRIKEAQIALLRERRQILIQEAVTRGLNPDTAMKDSGIDWIGQIPAHWDAIRFKNLFSQSRLPVRKEDGVVTSFRDGQVTLRSNRRMEGFTEAIIEGGYQGIRKGQLTLNSMDAFEGAIGVSESDGKCTPEYVICDPKADGLSPDYFAFQLREMALARYIQVICNAVRQRAVRIRYNNLASRFLVLPPEKEQLEIVAFIETTKVKIGNAITLKQDQITALKEYKTSLINAAVTGKIKVI